MEQNELNARAIIAGDLYKEGRIIRPECFRLEMDAYLGKDTGSIKYELNKDHQEVSEFNNI